ncbi:MAG TPA: glycoside hydrolase domain-containing protein [Anaeromyxobacteraceae bacterium]|nr:glycoside hydrolase domain-containing protein [Anaeromyxobacteraceae bacterium]
MLITRRATLILSALLSALPAIASAATVWTASANEKIRPQEAARSDRSASLSAAKNEFEAFQVVVTGPATGVSVSASALTGPGTVAAPKLFREAIIDLQHPSSADGATGAFPDALVPDVDDVVGEKRNAFPFDVPAGESRAVWVELHVPQDAQAGDYTGSVTVHGADGDTQIPVKLTVWDFALPSTSSLKTAFAMTYGGVAKVHGVSGEALTELRQKYAQLALDHRFSISDIWDDGQTGDWSHFDNAYGPLMDGHASTQLKGAKLTSLQSGADLNSAAAHGDWASHFKAKGWFDRLFQYTCDEPPLTCQWSDIAPRAQNAKQADPNFRTLVTTDMAEASKNGVLDSIDLMVPLVNYMDDRPQSAYGWTPGGPTRSQYDGFLQKPNKELWVYQSCMSHGCGGTVDIGNPSADQMYFTGWPSYAIDASNVRNRAMEWFSFQYGATGELYYETTQAYYDKADPWTDQYEFNGNGDGTLFYPGTTDKIGGKTAIPVASIRMKMIREGMEDYEYLKLLADAGGADDAKKIAQQLFPHPWQSEAKPADLMAARDAIAHKIMSLGSSKAVATAGNSTLSSGGGGGGGCGTSAGQPGGLFTLALVPFALVLQRVRVRRRRA